MITKLTPEQESWIPSHVEKYIKIGLSTDRIDKNKAEKYARKLYAFLGRKEKPITIIMGNPVTSWYATILLHQVRNQVGTQAGNQVETQVWNQVGTQVGNQVETQVWNQVGTQVGNQVENQVENQVRNQVRNQVWTQVENQVWNQVRNQVGNWIRPYLEGVWFSSYVAWFDFMKRIGVDFNKTRTYIYEDQLDFNYIYPLQKFCIFCEKPTKILRNKNGLHSDGSAALEYDDTFKIYSLNGVIVPEFLAVTPAMKIDAHKFAEIENAEVRREFLRKVGVEKILSDCGSILINKQGDYELHEIDLKGETGKWPYLKMLNPSIGVWHMECVAKECKTVEQALAWRDQETEYNKPAVLT